jgi:hypothetical protein
MDWMVFNDVFMVVAIGGFRKKSHDATDEPKFHGLFISRSLFLGHINSI